MIDNTEKEMFFHSVSLDKDKCVGCTNCIKRCPTQAIRVRNGLANIEKGRCIDCGECIRACPHQAKIPLNDYFQDENTYTYRVALIAPSFYSQFGFPAKRENIIDSIYEIGFDDVYEVSYGADIVSNKTLEILNSSDKNLSRPIISSACPVVVRLIQIKFPGLIDNLLNIDSPMEVTAKLARDEIVAKKGLANEKIGVYFISPCPSKHTAVKNPIGKKSSYVDKVLSFSDVYPLVLEVLDKDSHQFTGKSKEKKIPTHYGIRWGNIGGEALALKTEKFLAVDGIHNVISILEEIESERIKDVDFIEANSCVGGCIGGTLTVTNMYTSKTRLSRYLNDTKNKIKKNAGLAFDASKYEAAYWDNIIEANPILNIDSDISQALVKYEKMQKIKDDLPGLDCGACGAPDCAALAEDIVKGQASETDCIFKLKEKIFEVANQMMELENSMSQSYKKLQNKDK